MRTIKIDQNGDRSLIKAINALKRQALIVCLFGLSISLPIYCQTDVPASGKRVSNPKSSSTLTNPYTVNTPNAEITQDEKVEQLVQKAATYVDEKGTAVALNEFIKKNGLFSKNKLTIFALDRLGSKLANSFGNDLMTKKPEDLSNEKFVTRELIAKAKRGGGWVRYRWLNPETGKRDCKKSYVLPMGKRGSTQQFLIGSGYFYPENVKGECD